jgi:hypothetical protein
VLEGLQALKYVPISAVFEENDTSCIYSLFPSFVLLPLALLSFPHPRLIRANAYGVFTIDHALY